MTLQAQTEVALINLRYMLADALELCRSLRASESVVIERLINYATLQVMLKLQWTRHDAAALAQSARNLSSAA